MRVLCLHGQGTNSRILASQIETVRELLPDYFEYHYLDGEYECEAGEGIRDVFPGPYLCYYPMPPTTANIRRAHELVLDTTENHGPFDMIIGFSQGAALAASLLLHQQFAEPNTKPLFQAAVFICASLPFSASTECGIECAEDFDLTAAATTRIVPHHSDNGAKSDLNVDVYGDAYSINHLIRRFDPTHDNFRIPISTAHIVGKQDRWAPQGRKLSTLCASNLVFFHEHPEGHNIPRDKRVGGRIANAIEKALRRSQVP